MRYSGGTGRVLFIENLGGLSFAPLQALYITTVSPFVPQRLGNVVAADLDGDGDGDPDLAVSTADGFAWRENVQGTLGARQDLPAPTDGCRIYAEDLDGDGHRDLVIAGAAITWHPGQSASASGPSFGAARTIPLTHRAFALGFADMDVDGDLDVVTNGGDRIVLCLNDGRGTFAAGRVLSDQATNSRSPTSMATASPRCCSRLGAGPPCRS